MLLLTRLKPLAWHVLSLLCVLTASSCERADKVSSLNAQNLPNTLRIGYYNNFSDDDSNSLGGFYRNLNHFFYDSVLDITSQNGVQPVLAKKIVFDEKRGGWLVTLHENVSFHDGSVMTAADVLATLNCLWTLEKKSADNLGLFAGVDGFQIIDKYNVLVKTKTLTRQPPLALVIEITRADQTKCAGYNDKVSRSVGSGPYELERWDKSEIVLKRNVHYWLGAPKIERLSFRSYVDKREAWAAVIKGDLDLFFDANQDTALLTDNVPHLKNTSYPSGFFYMFMFNMKNPRLLDKRVRQALNLAINRQQIVTNILGNQGSLSSGVLNAKSSPIKIKEIPAYEYDPHKALELFKQAGYVLNSRKNVLEKNGVALKFLAIGMLGDNESSRLMRELELQLMEIGVSLNIEMFTPDEMMGRVFQRQADIYQLYSRTYYNADLLYNYWSGDINKSVFPYFNPTMTKTFNEFFKQPYANEAEFLNMFQKLLYEEPPGIFLYWKNRSITIHRRVQIPDMYWLNDLSNIWQWSIDPQWSTKKQ